MRQAIAALLLALPLTTLAQDATTPPAATGGAEAVPAAPAEYAPVAATATPAVPMFTANEPSWSIGAGVGFYSTYRSAYYWLGNGLAGFPVNLSPPWLSVVTSLERRLGGRTWLVIGASGTFSDDRNAWENVTATSGLWAEQKFLVVQGSTGVRQALTRPTAPVEVSILALAEGGVLDASIEDGTGAVADQTGWYAGGSLGFSVERVLVDRLSLRLATPVVAVSYSKSETTLPGDARVTSTGSAANLVLAPRLELRLAF